jgi:hypothetical protein
MSRQQTSMCCCCVQGCWCLCTDTGSVA